MKALQSVREFYEFVGLKPPQSDRNRLISSIRCGFVFISLIPMLISSSVVFVHPDISDIGYVGAFYVFITTIASMLNLLISFSKIADIYLFFDQIEQSRQKS